MQSIKNRFVALIGLGYWGCNLFRNFYELDVLNTACDSNHSTILNFKKRFPDINYLHSLEDVLDNPDIKAVAIATPAVSHYDIAKKTLQSRKDVFVEKPLALTSKQGKELVKLAKKQNSILMVGHILQYHPAIRKLKEMIAAGKLGKIQYIYSNRLNIGKLRTEENILWSFAPHDISTILMLLDEEPFRVSAFGGDYLTAGISDVTLTMLEFKNGVKGHIYVSWLHPYKEQKLIVVGSKAMAVFDDMSKNKLLLYPHTIKFRNGTIPVVLKANHQVIPVNTSEPLRLELEHFVHCAKTKTIPLTDGAEGLRVLRILEAAEKSLADKVCYKNKRRSRL